MITLRLLLLLAAYCCCYICSATEEPPSKQLPILNITNRVVGGNPVPTTTKYPFFIEWEDAKCGASLIHDDIAISAAHCENDLHPFDTRVFLLGLTTEQGIPRFIERQVAHPLYQGGKEDYDFLLFKLSESALVDANGNPTGAALVELNTDPNIPQLGDALTGMGFGKTNQDATETSPVFNEVEIYYVDDDTCRQQYGNSDFLKELMFCAGVPGGGKDTCQVSIATAVFFGYD
jgi:secreted trypsin-like serine protease